MNVRAHPLENRVPPPVVCLLTGVAMWVLQGPPITGNPRGATLAVAGSLILIGFGFLVAGFRAFRTARTTIDPVRIDAAAALVTGGIFRLTRNPMYVGFACLLLGWAAWLASPWTLLGPVAFVIFIQRFQIAPEERAMERLFGAEYQSYCRRVRRWL